MVADFDTVYNQTAKPSGPPSVFKPECNPSDGCFPASHVAPQTEFLQNTYLMRPDRKYMPAGAVPIRAGNLCRNK